VLCELLGDRAQHHGLQLRVQPQHGLESGW
jgi:hypothetical protein